MHFSTTITRFSYSPLCPCTLKMGLRLHLSILPPSYALGSCLTFSRGCSDSSATPSFPSQPEGKFGLPMANTRGREGQCPGENSGVSAALSACQFPEFLSSPLPPTLLALSSCCSWAAERAGATVCGNKQVGRNRPRIRLSQKPSGPQGGLGFSFGRLASS